MLYNTDSTTAAVPPASLDIGTNLTGRAAEQLVIPVPLGDRLIVLDGTRLEDWAGVHPLALRLWAARLDVAEGTPLAFTAQLFDEIAAIRTLCAMPPFAQPVTQSAAAR